MKNIMKLGFEDDHQLVRDGFKQLLEITNKYEVVLEADSYTDAVIKLAQLDQVSIVVVDISLPDKNGLELLKFISEKYQNIRCIVVSMYAHNPYVSKALESGAWGYVSKRAAATELITALESVENGETYLSQDVAKKLHVSGGANGSNVLESLTPRERDVFPLLAKGLNAKQVAKELGIMPKTAHVHRANILQKLSADNQFDLFKLAISAGLITYEELP